MSEWSSYMFLVDDFCMFCEKMGYHYIGEYDSESDLTVIDGLITNIALEIIPKITLFKLQTNNGRLTELSETLHETANKNESSTASSKSWSGSEQYPSPIGETSIKVMTSPTSKGAGEGESESDINTTNDIKSSKISPSDADAYLNNKSYVIWSIFFNSIKRIVKEYCYII